VEGPHGRRGGRGHHPDRGRARPAVPRADRRHLLVRVVLVEDLALPEGSPRRLRRRPQLVELADYIPAVLAGLSDPAKIQRCVCAAGHKAMYSDVWGGLPAKDFLKRLDPRLADLRDRLYEKAHAADRRPAHCRGVGGEAGPEGGPPHRDGASMRTTARWAPACARARSSRSSAPPPATAPWPRRRRRSRTCPASADRERSIMPGYYGIEAGQSAVGDILKWWVEGVCEGDEKLHATLSAEAAKLQPGSRASSPRLEQRQPDDPRRPLLTGLLVGQTLHTTRPRSTGPSSRRPPTAPARSSSHERVRRPHRPRRLLRRDRGEERALHADLRRRDRPPMLIAGSPQTPALGSAISAAVLAGAHPSFEAAQEKMTNLKEKRYTPTRPRSASTTSSTGSTASCTTASAASRRRRPTSPPS